MLHDIIDNRNEKLVEHINLILDSTEKARFAVGYFFLSGFQSIAEELKDVKELRLLIGNATNRGDAGAACRRASTLGAGCRDCRIPSLPQARRPPADGGRHRGKHQPIRRVYGSDRRRRKPDKVASRDDHRKTSFGARSIPKVGCTPKPTSSTIAATDATRRGAAIVGSSNLTLSGLNHNTELNVVVQGNANHAELCRWFDALWDEAEDFDLSLMAAMKASWGVRSRQALRHLHEDVVRVGQRSAGRRR